MTTKEAMRRAWEAAREGAWLSDDCWNETYFDFDSWYEANKGEVEGWIDCKVRLPEVGSCKLVWSKSQRGAHVYMATRRKDHWEPDHDNVGGPDMEIDRWYDSEVLSSWNSVITHWRDLPEGPG
jgi:hypothetical protein